MKILLDQCFPSPMRKMLVGQKLSNPYKCNRNEVTNGQLLKLVENQFELFITSDQNLRSGPRIAILELSTNDLRRILVAGPSIIEAVASNVRRRIPPTGNP